MIVFFKLPMINSLYSIYLIDKNFESRTIKTLLGKSLIKRRPSGKRSLLFRHNNKRLALKKPKYHRSITSKIIIEPTTTKSIVCTDKMYCSKLKPFEKICEIDKIGQDCPILCQRCEPCKDDSACRFVNDIQNVCKTQPHVQSLCQRTCNKCVVQANRTGAYMIAVKHFLTMLFNV